MATFKFTDNTNNETVNVPLGTETGYTANYERIDQRAFSDHGAPLAPTPSTVS